MTDKKTRKPRAKKEDKVEKYPIQIPIALDKKEQLEKLAKEMDLSLAQYCRCILLQHLKNEDDMFKSNKNVVVKEQITTTNQATTTDEEVRKILSDETLIENKETEKKKSKVRGFGAK